MNFSMSLNPGRNLQSKGFFKGTTSMWVTYSSANLCAARENVEFYYLHIYVEIAKSLNPSRNPQ